MLSARRVPCGSAGRAARHTELTIDVVQGRGAGFSLEAPEGVRFLTRSRVFTIEELEILEREGPPPRGDAKT